MLNAFRHQRIKHAHSCPLACPSDLGAQRLSASTNQTPAHLTACCCHIGWCSTPFGINESNTRITHAPTASSWQCSTPFGINESNTTATVLTIGDSTQVLNAFRHQRIKHLRTLSPLVLFGHVLNAFRHQRIKHSMSTF